MRPGKPAAIVIQKRELHDFWAAKNYVAFLRNSHIGVLGQLFQIIAQ
jgi:hypothetical protein